MPLGQLDLPWGHQSSAPGSQVPAQLVMWDGGTMFPITTPLLTGFGAPGKPPFCQNVAAGAPKSPRLGCCGPPSCRKSIPHSRQRPMLASVWLRHSKTYCTEGFLPKQMAQHRARDWGRLKSVGMSPTGCHNKLNIFSRASKKERGWRYTHSFSQEAFYHGVCCLWD